MSGIDFKGLWMFMVGFKVCWNFCNFMVQLTCNGVLLGVAVNEGFCAKNQYIHMGTELFISLN